jgi:DNA-binding NtrC family response regulator
MPQPPGTGYASAGEAVENEVEMVVPWQLTHFAVKWRPAAKIASREVFTGEFCRSAACVLLGSGRGSSPMTTLVAKEARLDDRSPYAAAAAVVRTVAHLSNDLRDDEAVWAAFESWRGADAAEYIRTVRRTQHSLFYYQLQHLYEFGTEQVPAQFRETFSFLAGRRFAEATLDETIYPILQVALAQPGQFQTTVADMIQRYLYRFTGNKYRLTEEFEPTKVVLTLQERFAEEIVKYLRQYGLEPARAFQNSFNFICGAIDVFAAHVIKGYKTSPFAFQIADHRGLLTLPVAEQGAFDYEGLLQTLLGVIQQIQARQRSEVEERRLENDLVVASPAMRETWNKVRRASQSDESVLLLGESGTGKTFIAQKIHSLSRRRDGPFIPVGLTSDLGSDNIIQSNLFGHERGAFTGATEQKQGLFSLADGGTILLDEIGDASPELQAKLLRVIDTCTFKRLGGVRDIRVDVRIIAATHHSLEALTEAGKFRRDLFYRLNVIPIQVPPLREQPEAISALADFLLARLTRAPRQLPRKLAPDLVPLLQRYQWPGNIRELEHALRHAVAMSDTETLKLADFPAALRLSFQKGTQPAVAAPVSTGPPAEAAMIDAETLRLAIRATDISALKAANNKHELPCHIDFARKVYLAALIEECQGDLSVIGHYWDRHSEKTLRSLIKSYGLTERLHAARARAASPG